MPCPKRCLSVMFVFLYTLSPLSPTTLDNKQPTNPPITPMDLLRPPPTPNSTPTTNLRPTYLPSVRCVSCVLPTIQLDPSGITGHPGLMFL